MIRMISFLLALLGSQVALAGVVFEIETIDHTGYGARSEVSELMVEGRNLKMDVSGGSDAGQSGDYSGAMSGSAMDSASGSAMAGSTKRSDPDQEEMIFRAQDREMLAIDHRRRSYQVMSVDGMRDTMSEVQNQAIPAMPDLNELLKDATPEQREAMGDLAALLGGAAAGGIEMRKQRERANSTPRLTNTGERSDKHGYPCVKWVVNKGDQKVQELWVTDWDNIEGSREARDAFMEMGKFFKELRAAMGGLGQGFDDNFANFIDEVDGFPVVTREFNDQDGTLESESHLRSAKRRTLDPAAFDPPAGYKRQTMGSF